MKVFITSKFLCWSLIPDVMTFGGGALGRQSDQEGRDPLNLKKRCVRSLSYPLLLPPSLLPLLCPSLSTICKLGRPSPDPGSSSTLILDFPTSRIMRNQCLLFKPSRQLWYSVIRVWTDWNEQCIYFLFVMEFVLIVLLEDFIKNKPLWSSFAGLSWGNAETSECGSCQLLPS
jgi:hypothetical protein